MNASCFSVEKDVIGLEDYSGNGSLDGHAGLVHLVERQPSKLYVASSSLASCSEVNPTGHANETHRPNGLIGLLG